ncbi:hypothetical protein ES707_11341 [subsurface metagenome]
MTRTADLTEFNRTAVVGLPGSGKSEWAKAAARDTIAAGGRVLVIDVLGEYTKLPKGAIVYLVQNMQEPLQEVELLLKRLICDPYKRTGKQPFDLLICEESSRYFRNQSRLPPNFGLINDVNRHMKLKVICIARRFVQMHTDIAELAHELIIYRQTGINDLKRLDDTVQGLCVAVESLPKYHFVRADSERKYAIRRPIRIK